MTFMRYLLVQLVAYAIDLGTFVLLFEFSTLRALPANVVAKIAAGAFAFAAHRAFTFRVDGRARIGREALRYAVLLALNVPLASGLLALLMTVIPQPTIAKIVSDVLCVGITFALTKHAVFGAPSARRAERPLADR